MISSSLWAQTPDGPAWLHTLSRGGMRASITTFGGTVTSLQVPGKGEASGEVTLGYSDLAGYEADPCYLGRLVGRVANRIGQARFELRGKVHQLDRNHGKHHLHGGTHGFHARLWQGEPGEQDGHPCLRLILTSEDGDQGYPGRLEATVTYTLTDDALRIEYLAGSDAPTPVNLTNHMYFNLDGPASGDCLGHSLRLAASRVQEGDPEQIPSGRLLDVTGTLLDFRTAKPIGRDLDETHPLQAAEHGFDHSFVLDAEAGAGGPVAVLESAAAGRRMEVHTDCPCVQFYSGNYIPDGLRGRAGEVYAIRQALCLETQEYVDAVNHPGFPSIILQPGQRYERTTEYVFSLI